MSIDVNAAKVAAYQEAGLLCAGPYCLLAPAPGDCYCQACFETALSCHHSRLAEGDQHSCSMCMSVEEMWERAYEAHDDAMEPGNWGGPTYEPTIYL